MSIKHKKFIKIILGLLIVVTVLLSLVWYTGQRGDELEFIALDIGQGDALLIKTPYGQNVLIDGGPDNSVIQRLGKNLPFYDRTIDLMILTHPDADHVTGLVEVLRRYKVKKILHTGVKHNSSNYAEWLKAVDEEEGAEVEICGDEQTIMLGEGLVMEVIYPDQLYFGLEVEDVNAISIVTRLVYGDTSFMLTGDATIETEKELIAKNIDLKSDVLKAGHHGSKTSTCIEFVQAVDPDYGIISSGKDNNFGHPNLRVLRNLEKEGVEILRTDEMGDVILISNGEYIRKP